MKHVGDHDMQRYLDGAAGGDTQALDSHFAICPLCRKRLAEYRMLFADLGEDVAILHLGGITDGVMARITAGRQSEGRSGLVDAVLAISGALLALAALWVFVGLGPLPTGLADLTRSVRDLFGAGATATGGVGQSVLMSAALVIIIVFLVNGLAIRRAGTGSHSS